MSAKLHGRKAMNLHGYEASSDSLAASPLPTPAKRPVWVR